jgi:hypothetical protein
MVVVGTSDIDPDLGNGFMTLEQVAARLGWSAAQVEDHVAERDAVDDGEPTAGDLARVELLNRQRRQQRAS